MKFDPIEPQLFEDAQMSILRLKEAALQSLAEDIGVTPADLLAISEFLPEESNLDPTVSIEGEAVEPPCGAVDEPLAEESASEDLEEEDVSASDFDLWASDLLGADAEVANE